MLPDAIDHLTDGVLLGGELQGASCEGAVEEEVVDAAGEEGHQGAEAVQRQAAVAGVEDGAEGALEQEHHRAWAVVCVEGGNGEVAVGVGDAQRRGARLQLDERGPVELGEDAEGDEDGEARGVDRGGG